DFDSRLPAGLGLVIVYAYNLEPPLARRWKPTQILPCHRRDLPPFVPVHGRFPGLNLQRSPGFNFNKTENISLPSDQVDLSPTTNRPEVPRHHDVAKPAQKEISVLFPPP